ncbi:tetratricopeptide repeat protein [Fervidibacillus halotolerans]|uniref:Tetratricopeptide repeat protein n=1 Tax=Fervidibacillus halotolerans TaxID=2980027 RepID=A0A9E8RYZ9_9BACI|nr:tetratricopeptide repeat protein [Fervidibacillus halotolerans]WAA13366.1 tetratricopeptide repeat protein [Fervidibacillus halotolerans]
MHARELRRLSIEQLLKLKPEVVLNHFSEQPYSSYTLIEFYKELYRKLKMDRTTKYDGLLNETKGNLIQALIQYGTYLKMEGKKDQRVAKDCLKEALRIDRNLPIAHYRIGFLAYQEKRYDEALIHFQQALSIPEGNIETKYALNERQKRYAKLYFINCSLHLATELNETLDSFDDEIEPLPGYDFSPYFDMIHRNEEYLGRHKIITRDGETFCFKDEIDEYLDQENTIVLYFSDHENVVCFNGKQRTLHKNRAELLRYLLLYGKNTRPIMMRDLSDLISTHQTGDQNNDAYRQAIRRLRDDLEQIGLSRQLIKSKPYDGIPGYYFTDDIPFTIIHRPDVDFILP